MAGGMGAKTLCVPQMGPSYLAPNSRFHFAPGEDALVLFVWVVCPGGMGPPDHPGTSLPPPPPKLHSRFPPRGRGMPAVVRMPACHSRRFKGERPMGAATG